MLKNVGSLAAGISLLALLCLPGLARAHGHDYLFSNGDHYVRIEPDRVIIKGDRAKRAVIGKTGTLQIGTQPVTVPAKDRKYLANYYAIVFELRDQARRVANKAMSDAWRTVGDVLGAVFSGSGSSASEAAEQKKLRQSVHADVAPLCRKVAQLKALQDKVALDVPRFKPYAILKRHTVANCPH